MPNAVPTEFTHCRDCGNLPHVMIRPAASQSRMTHFCYASCCYAVGFEFDSDALDLSLSLRRLSALWGAVCGRMIPGVTDETPLMRFDPSPYMYEGFNLSVVGSTGIPEVDMGSAGGNAFHVSGIRVASALLAAMRQSCPWQDHYARSMINAEVCVRERLSPALYGANTDDSNYVREAEQ